MTNPVDNRSWWRSKAILLQKILDARTADYDAVEAELKALLTPALTEDPNPSLLALSHTDLALLADQYRVRLLKGSQTMPLTNAQGLEEEPLPTTLAELE